MVTLAKSKPNGTKKRDLQSDQEAIADEVRDAALEIEANRKRLDISQDKLCEKYSDLGSRRTLKRALAGELDDAAMLIKYKTVCSLMELESTVDDNEIYDDFSAFLQARMAFIEMAREGGLRRFLPILGHSGAGKTTFVNWLNDKYPGRVVIVEATPQWRNSNRIGSGRSLCATILKKLGISHMPPRNLDLQNETVEQLNKRRVCVVIEEAHEMCLDGLMTIKAMINQTQGEFVVTAHPKLWADLQKSSYSSCSQLTGNRLWEKINFELETEDVAKWFERKMPAFTKSGKMAADEALLEASAHVVRMARGNGGWNFLKGIGEQLNREGVEALTMANVTAAANKEVGRR